MEDTKTELHPFSEVTRWNPSGDGRWDGAITPDWTQSGGRTAFGGLVAAGAVRALCDWMGPERHLRHFFCQFMRPLPAGPIHAQARKMQEGRNVTLAELNVEREGATCSFMRATFVSDRESAVRVPGPPADPARGTPEDHPSIPYLEEFMPPFLQHVRQSYVKGAPPFVGNGETEMDVWVRIENAGAHAPSAITAAMDGIPFPIMQMLEKPAPATSVAWSCHLFDTEGVNPSEPFWLQAHTVLAERAYGTFSTHLYTPDGVLRAWAEQLIGIYDGPSAGASGTST
jgi:acyl-CoA thioesterase